MNVGKVLFPLFALALELPEAYFDDKVSLVLVHYSYFARNLIEYFETQNSAAIMKILHYPLQDGYPGVNDDTPGVGAHTEYLIFLTSLILLLMSSVVLRSEHPQSAPSPSMKLTRCLHIVFHHPLAAT